MALGLGMGLMMTPPRGMGTPAQRLLGTEANGMAVDFTSNTALVRDSVTGANNKSGAVSTVLSGTSPNYSIALSALPWSESGGTFIIEVLSQSVNTSTRYALFRGTNARYLYQNGTVDTVSAFNAAGWGYASLPVSTTRKLGISMSAATVTLADNSGGSAGIRQQATPVSNNFLLTASGATLWIGTQGGSSTNSWFANSGNIKNVTYIARALSDAELLAKLG